MLVYDVSGRNGRFERRNKSITATGARGNGCVPHRPFHEGQPVGRVEMKGWSSRRPWNVGFIVHCSW